VVSEKRNFFISYNKADQENANWIAWILEEAGHSTIIQAWDFLTGSNFAIEMQNASVDCDHTIALLSQAYMNAQFTQPEWAAAFSKDPTGEKGILIPIRVEDFNVPGMLGNIVYIDLVGLDEADAQKKLLNEIDARVKDTRRKPDKKPLFSPISKKSSTEPKPAFNPIPVTFARLRLGSTDELVGRQDSLEWLDNKLLKSNGCTCALASLQGMGGMGKTFLSQVFAEKNREKAMFFPVYLGETSPFNAGVQLLQKQGIETAHIDTNEKLTGALNEFYSSTKGILILDDVKSVEAETLLPRVAGWSILITTRDKTLARRLCGDKNVKELDVLSGEDAIRLMRKVLQDNFRESQLNDYEKLCEHLSWRPYSVRLAAGYLLNALDPCPSKLLNRMKAGKPVAADDDLDFAKIRVLLEDCLSQLEQKSALAVRLVHALSAGADQGMPLERFIQWQQESVGCSEEVIERALIAAHDSGIVLTEKDTAGETDRIKLRLHTDLLRVVRGKEQPEMVDSLITYLDNLLVKRTYQKNLDRPMYLQVFALVERYKENKEIVRTLYDTFWIPLLRTGELKQAFELGDLFTKHAKTVGDRDDLQRSYGNQALILQDWGRLEEAMELHKKKEAICLELGNRNGLGISYGNQALILNNWDRLEEAMELHKKEEAICFELGNREGLQASYGNQALILNKWGRLEEAMELHKKEEAICFELGNREGLQASYGNQAVILKDWGRLEEAMELHKKKETICLELGNRNGLQKCYCNQALILKAWGRLEEAMELHKKEETICLELGNRDSLNRSYGNQALILQDWGRLEEAMELHKKEEAICLELGNRNGLQISYGNQALILKAWGRLEEAMELHKKEETICIEVGLKRSLKICYKNQINLYNKMEKKKEAEEVRQKLAALEREMGEKK
jgi:tetratricopeptide (TPR) repeat protein